jgi:NitT/TauT family transport system substrate-binding protein
VDADDEMTRMDAMMKRGNDDKQSMIKRGKGIAMVSLFLCLWSLPVSAQTTIRMGAGGAQTATIPFTIGAKQGIFAKHGINLEIITIANEQTATRALISGSVEFVTSITVGFFYLARQGGDAVGIASWNNSSPYSLASRLKIKDLSGLKGRKIATSGAGGRSDAFIRFMLTKIGLDPRSDAQILPLSGGSGVRLAALLSGNIDATLISYTQEKQAEKLGLTIIPIPMQYIQGQISTRRSYLEKNPKMVKAFLLSLSETIRAVRADRSAAMKVIAQVLKADDKEVLEHAYNGLRSQVVPDLLPTEEAIVNVLKIMSYEDAAFATIAPFKHFDLSLVKEIASEQPRGR